MSPAPEFSTLRQALNLEITEKDFQQQVIDYARLHRWLVYHTYDSRRSESGYPDLTLVRGRSGPVPPRLIFAECKREKGTLTDAQHAWLDALDTTGVEVYVWRPSDFPRIMELLR